MNRSGMLENEAPIMKFRRHLTLDRCQVQLFEDFTEKRGFDVRQAWKDITRSLHTRAPAQILMT
jgi:hypothetical protein